MTDELLLYEVENIAKEWARKTAPVSNLVKLDVYDVDKNYAKWNTCENLISGPRKQLTIYMKWMDGSGEDKSINSRYTISYDELRIVKENLKDFIHRTLFNMHMDALNFALSSKEDR